MDDIAPMIVMVTLILTTGGVIVLRPLVKHLAAYLQMLTQQKESPAVERDVAQVRELLANVDSRLTLMEERQHFTESLLTARPGRPEIAPPAPPPLKSDA